MKIFIDPGHGGTDPGATGNGLREKDLTLAISLKIRDLLAAYKNVQVKLSRESDKTVTLKQRTDEANAWGADYLISVHINAGGGQGFESYVYTNVGQKTADYQNGMHTEIMKQVDFVDRGKKRANFHMLRETKMPAILTENGFIDKVNDAVKLKEGSYLERIARGHVNGIAKVFSLEKVQTAPVTDKLYKVQVGAFADKANADKLAAELKSKGYEAFVILI